MAEPLYTAHPTMFADEPGKFLFACLLIPVFGIGLVWLLWWYVNNRSTLVTVDENRVSWRSGLLSKDHVEIELRNVRGVRIDQSFFDRIFNCAKLKVFASGDTPEIDQSGLPNPTALRTALRTARSRP